MNEQLHKMNLELQNKISAEIENEKKQSCRERQLKLILSELQLIETNPNYILSFSRIIIDSWDFADPLGAELLEFESLFQKSKLKKC